MINLPREIDPSTIDVGDEIIITLPRNQGIIHTVQGKVSQIEINGQMTTFLTFEGGQILSWFPGMKTDIRTILVKRDPQPETELFNFNDLMDQLRPRIA